MRTERVPLSALSDHFKPMAAAFAADDPRLRSRFPVSWRDEKGLVAHVRGAASRGVDPDLKLDPGPAFDKLKKGAPAVVTGQQPSVALGPMYNVYKAITAVRWARKLDAVPVFWNHSDDDNLEGLNRVATPEGAVEAAWSGDGALAFRTATLDLEALEKLGADVSVLRANLRGDVAGDFTRLLRALFGDELLIVEPRQLDGPRAQEILRKALDNRNLVQSAIDRGGEKLKELGFERALGHKLGSNVYAFDGPRRIPAESPSGRLSAGVAMRLIVQDAVLPTALVIAGPNELAYLAQLRELYEAFGRSGPVVAPRITATLVDPRAARIANTLGLSGAQLLAREDSIRFGAALEATSDILKSVNALDEELVGRMQSLEAALRPGQKDLARKTSEKISSVIAAFGQRIAAAEKEADAVASERAKKLVAHLTPDGKLQERVMSVWYFRAIAGPDLIKKLTDELDPFCPDHQVAWL